MTSTRAGNTPANKADIPSSLSKALIVAKVEAFLALRFSWRLSSLTSDLQAVIRVLTTHMGLVMSTVALPAIAPAIMDSIVVSFFEARPAFMAAPSKVARVNSYPDFFE